MKTLKILLIGMLVVMLAVGSAYAAPKGNSGQGNQGQGNQGQGNQGDNGHGNQGNNGQGIGRANRIDRIDFPRSNRSSNKIRTDRAEKGRKQADLRANRPENANGAKEKNRARADRGKSADHRNIKEDKTHPHDLLAALEKARWSHNPKDERGQGNMGKPNMRDPYGHDKDSGREGSERGRAIHMPEINLAEMISIDFTMPDYMVYRMQQVLENPQSPEHAAFLELLINHFTEEPPSYNWITTQKKYYEKQEEIIDYTLTLPDGFEGTTLLVTTTLTSTENFFDVLSGPGGIRYAAGEVVMEQADEVILGEDNTYSFSYDPPWNIAGWSDLWTDLTVTVTEPQSGQSYTMNYDRQVVLWRCPYGKVTDKKTGESIVGAKVTVHFEDGSIVALDKASNPTASNPQITDATGRYGFKLQTNRKYYLRATADGYKDYKSEVFTEKWHVLREDVALTSVEKEELVAMKVE